MSFIVIKIKYEQNNIKMLFKYIIYFLETKSRRFMNSFT